MQANDATSATGRDDSPHDAALASYDAALRLAHAGQIASIRALAELGRSALREARRESIRGMASDMELRSVAAEAAGMARSSDRRLQSEIDHAMTVVDDYPTVFTAWEERRITREHVDVVVKVGTVVPEDLRPEFEVAAVAVCERDIATRVREPLRALAEKLHHRPFTERHREAAAQRCVRVVHDADGMSTVTATVPTVLATGMIDRLTQIAQTVKDARGGDSGAAFGIDSAPQLDARTMDQLRADALTDLVLGGAPVVDPASGSDGAGPLGAIRARVQVVITADTLAGKDEHPAEAVGAALVDAQTVRELAAQTTTWDRLFIGPVSRTPVEIDTYRPTAAMSRLLKARDQHCRFPGCRRAAIRSRSTTPSTTPTAATPTSSTSPTCARDTTR
ncbi:DUF222 domain-containing protein [Microbacterium oleivorans]|uniref:DUF222 domain-containing protein n=1 Tax=Microbacterium oleivorans TaxID=273677 RepID=UPI002115EE32|nr:DUF222 domain-containing protein [Microbacterium oleivorans]